MSETELQIAPVEPGQWRHFTPTFEENDEAPVTRCAIEGGVA